ncbi:MAG: hypothetical protein EHM64_03050 [Ignavibacteriae bacterium]|nr:MAG: hypothetical protein EHM64_03050 [Ignavibacteriota bacterium]
MNKKFAFLILPFIIFTTPLPGQSKVTIFTIGSYNSFSMTDLKQLQQELLNDMRTTGVPARIVESYPSFYGFKGGFLIPVQQNETSLFSMGGIAEYTSAGGRVHYQDYSGELRADEIAAVWSFGGIMEYRTNPDNIFCVSFQATSRIFFSMLKYTLVTQVGNSSKTQEMQFHSLSFGLEPGIVPTFKCYDFQLGLSLSYLLFIPKNLQFDENSKADLRNNKGSQVTIDWSGYRIGILLGYSF